jgi:hypothetical protein
VDGEKIIDHKLHSADRRLSDGEFRANSGPDRAAAYSVNPGGRDRTGQRPTRAVCQLYDSGLTALDAGMTSITATLTSLPNVRDPETIPKAKRDLNSNEEEKV